MFRVGGRSWASLCIGGAGSREREEWELGGYASLRLSGRGLEPGDSSRLKSSQSCWDNVRGEEERIRFLVDWAACWDVDGLVTAITACCNSLAHIHRSVPGSAGGRLGRAWEALWSTERLLGG